MALIPYDDRDGFIWMDGQLMPWRDCKVHFMTHALHYAGGIFEGVRCYNGKIFKLNEHSQRMLDGCKTLDMKIEYSLEQINQACIEAVRANNITDGYLRPLAWRGAEQIGVSAPLAKIHLAVAAWDWPQYYKGDLLEKGISIATSKWRRPAPDTAPVHAKASGLYMICTISKQEAENQGCNDALMLDYRGHVAELTSANLFMVKNGELHTPTPDCFLNGITRQTVIELAEGLGFKVHVRTILPEDLKTGDEFFATGTAAEITPIGKIDGTEYKVGPVTRKIREAYSTLVRGGLAEKVA
ncbi:MAG: branched-chain amino acid aminotransferase [Bdellovibrionales bacterium]|jgi:branched-chain amino acid aminotransferase|nr:branched-chain amino acid aminotransferase [Bdellovibrionales bacterium]